MSQQIENNENNDIDAGKGIKSFKNSQEVENLYRFIHDNDIRRESEIMFRIIVSGMKRMNKRKVSSSARKIQ